VMHGEQDRTCAWTLDAIESYLDSDLSEEAALALERHVAACGDCAEELALARAAGQTLQAMPKVPCDEALTRRLLAVPNAEAPRHCPRTARLALSAAAVLVVLVGVLPAWLPRSTPPPENVTREDILRAEMQLRGTFAYLAHLGQQTARTVGQEVIRDGLAPPLLRQTRRLLSDIESVEQPITPRKTNP